MKSKTFSYVQIVSGRNTGRIIVTRWCKIGNLGDISYVEKREPNKEYFKNFPLPETHWKIGNVTAIIQSKMKASCKQEYVKNLKQAMAVIMNVNI